MANYVSDADKIAMGYIEMCENQYARLRDIACPIQVKKMDKIFASSRELIANGEYSRAVSKAKAGWAKFMNYAVEAKLI